MYPRAVNAEPKAGALARLRAVAARVRCVPSSGLGFRQRLGRYLPIALLALVIQLLAPVAASAMAARAIAAADPFGGAAICHTDIDPTQSDREADRTSCGLDCVMCCVLHVVAALDTPPAPASAEPVRLTSLIEWSARELRLVHLPARSQAQPRGPPVPS